MDTRMVWHGGWYACLVLSVLLLVALNTVRGWRACCRWVASPGLWMGLISGASVVLVVAALVWALARL